MTGDTIARIGPIIGDLLLDRHRDRSARVLVAVILRRSVFGVQLFSRLAEPARQLLQSALLRQR